MASTARGKTSFPFPWVLTKKTMNAGRLTPLTFGAQNEPFLPTPALLELYTPALLELHHFPLEAFYVFPFPLEQRTVASAHKRTILLAHYMRLFLLRASTHCLTSPLFREGGISGTDTPILARYTQSLHSKQRVSLFNA